MDGKEEKDEQKKDEEMQKGGEPSWVQKLEQSMNRLAEKLETAPEQTKGNPVQVPVPPTPEPEQETADEPETLDEPTPQEKPKSKGKKFLDWLL